MRVRRVWRAWLCGWCSGSVSPGTLLAVDGSDSMLSLPGVQAQPLVRELRSYMPHSKIKKKKKKKLSAPVFSLGPERRTRTLDLEETDPELPVTGGEV